MQFVRRRALPSLPVPVPVVGLFFRVLAMTVLGAAVASCASGYSPPAERRDADRCPIVGEVWVCEDRYPSRIESENKVEPFCRCEDPGRLR